MRDLLKKLLMAGLVASLVFAFAACGETGGDEETTATTEEPTTEATEATTEAAGDYDILEGSQLVDGLLYGNDFLLIMPDNDSWGYEKTSDTTLEIYLKSARDDGYGGNLVTIMAFDPEDTSYENFPDYSVAGHGQNCGKTFVALFPTDVQFNPQDADQQAAYQDLYTYVKKIGEGAVNSPFQTADSD